MAIITAVERERRRRRAHVYFDSGEAISLRLDIIAREGLAAGSELDLRRRHELQALDQRLEAIDASLRLIAVGPRSRGDLRDRLLRRGFGRAAIDAALERMTELGYLDDAAFARSWVEARLAATPRSRRALAFELSRRGVSRELAEETVGGLSDADAAYEAASRRSRNLRAGDEAEFRRRLASFLASRGFSYGVVRAAIDRCWEELSSDAGAGDVNAARGWDAAVHTRTRHSGPSASPPRRMEAP
jgi:regulatory protein